MKKIGSVTILGFATLLGTIPMVLLSPFVGPLVGRWDKERLLTLTDTIVALFAAVLVVTGMISDIFLLWLVFVSLLIRAVAQTFQIPTIQSILPMMVPKEELVRINGQLGMVQSVNFTITSIIGIFLFTVIPISWLISLDVLGTVFGVGLLVFATIPKVIS